MSIERDVQAIQVELPYLHSLARRLTGNPHDASDLVQDAVVRALRALPSLPDCAELRPWLATIVRNLHVDRIRQLAREPRPVALEDVSPLALCSDNVELATGDEPPSRASLEHALTLLPEEFRRVFVLHELEGRSYRDISAALAIPVATVGTRLSRARLRLRELLRKQ